MRMLDKLSGTRF